MSTAANTRLKRVRLCLEELEPRQLLSGYAPTGAEQLMLEQLNNARANPAAYGASIGLDLSGVAASQPLAFNPSLIEAARLHSQDMNARAYFAHNTLEGVDPGTRITNAGFAWNSWGESIAAGSAYPQPGNALAGLIIDAGIADLGHRKHLLAMESIFQTQNQVGIGVVQGGTGPYTNYYTIDSAEGTDVRPFITGVVYNDANHNGQYDIGEGLGNVSITVAGVGATATWGSGGYSIQVNPGTYTMTASGGGLASPFSQTVSVGSWNSRLNFVVAASSSGGLVSTASQNANYINKLYTTALGRTPAAAEVNNWMAVMNASGTATVANGILRSTESLARSVSGWYVTYLGRSADPGEAIAWANEISRGASEEQVIDAILGSQEYFDHANVLLGTSGSHASFIQELYSQILHRTASSAEITSWVNALPSLGRSGVAQGFLGSYEHRASDVRGLYGLWLNRTPALSEVDGWVNSGVDYLTMQVGFAGSTEAVIKS